MPLPPEPGEDARYVEQVIEQTEAAISRLREARRLIGQVEGTGEAADGLVRAMADGSGTLTGIDIKPRALRLSVAALGEEVTEAIRLAQQDASRRTGEIVEDAGAVVGMVPQPLDETFVRDRVEAAAAAMYRQP